jgi:ubiquinone/menaquinone biosynthesis C-methylase UbiE
MKKDYNQKVQSVIDSEGFSISVFDTSISSNIDQSVVESFGEEWSKFHSFSDSDIKKLGDMYFDILDDSIVNKNSYCLDVGCGTGRWTKYLIPKIGFMEAIDPSKAIIAASKILKGSDNVRLSVASSDTIPFPDETFDFGMSIGVLHHIPNTSKALADCVKKIKVGGYFYVYLYYNLDNRGFVFRSVFWLATLIRKIVSSMPGGLKRFSCDVLAITLYMPLVLLGRFLKAIGLKKIADKVPLSGYQDQSFYIIRNDALDRFGTTLEQRFSKAQVVEMMQQAGLSDIRVSDGLPLWHALGKRLR